MKDKNYWVEKLGLLPHPEGGFYKEVYRSNEIIPQAALPDRFTGDRVFLTSIYFLLDKEDFSAFHRIRQDEIWHFYTGTSLTIHIIDKDGDYSAIKLGLNIDDGEMPQVIVKAACFFAVEINDKSLFSLVACTVAPGFEFDDFEMPDKNKLLALFPQHRKIIKKYSR